MASPDENKAGYIPPQQRGNESDVADSDDYGSEQAAREAFARARSRMLAVNDWFAQMTKTAPFKTLGGLNPLIPVFTLLTGEGEDKPGEAEVGDLIKISAAGQDMYVHIEKIIDSDDEFALRVRPCNHDTAGCTPTEHVYTSEATNTFRLTRSGSQLTTGFHGRNEVTHDDLASQVVDTGLALGGRELNWQMLGRAWRPRPEGE